MKVLRLGTRGSPLALAQANLVRDALLAAHGWPAERIEIVPIKTTGDRVQDRALAEIGGKELWTRELDRALMDDVIDCSVHSMKDVETLRPPAIVLAAVLPRADVRDRLIGADSIAALRQGAVIGTSSPRRAAGMLRLRPDLRMTLLRGNVDRRLGQVASGEIDATLLAAAGLDRLGRDVGAPIPIETMLPAPAQGVIGVETRAGEESAMRLFAAIDHPVTRACLLAERGLLAALVADCHSPVGALATIEGAILTLRAELLSEDGQAHVHAQEAGDSRDPELPKSVARDLLDRAPPEVRGLFGG